MLDPQLSQVMMATLMYSSIDGSAHRIEPLVTASCDSNSKVLNRKSLRKHSDPVDIAISENISMMYMIRNVFYIVLNPHKKKNIWKLGINTFNQTLFSFEWCSKPYSMLLFKRALF